MYGYRLTIEYEGTRYRGWQEQPNARTVAGEIRRAVESGGLKILEFVGSGRTDAGVHALAQVAHLRLAGRAEPEALRRHVNDALPADIHVLAIEAAPRAFHARHDAIARSYVFQISRRRTALAKRFVWWVRDPLDAARMSVAAERLVGRHDFAQFCEKPKTQTSTIVVVESATLAESGSLILVRLVASHFLWKMVRRVVGGLVRVGAGRLSLDEFADWADGRVPSTARGAPAEWTAAASGLFLERVRYPGDPAPVDALLPPVPVP